VKKHDFYFFNSVVFCAEEFVLPAVKIFLSTSLSCKKGQNKDFYSSKKVSIFSNDFEAEDLDQCLADEACFITLAINSNNLKFFIN